MKKVLVIDDEPGICDLLKRSLESAGDFEVSVCTDSHEALHEARKRRPDVILIDVNMPGLSGPEIVEQLEDDVVTQSIPFVYLTGIVEPREVHERRNVIGGNYFIAKPFETSELVRVIDRVLSERTPG